MASCEPLSDKISKGQVVLLCQVCENDSKIKWKCLKCELMMCQKCKVKVHPKFDSAKEHIVIAIQDIGEHHMEFEPKSEPDLTRIMCAVHSGQNYCLYCTTCQKLVCQTCIFKSHMKHEFIEIFEEYRNSLEKIKNKQENIEKDIQTLTKSKEFLRQQKLTRRSHHDKVKQEILKDEEAIVDEVKKHTLKLFNELDQKWETISKSIDEKDDELEKKLTKSQEQHKEICKLKGNALYVFTFNESLLVSENAEFSLDNLAFNGVANFKCGEKTKLKEVFGSLEDGTTPYITELQIEKEFETEFKCVGRIASCSDDHLWICAGRVGLSSYSEGDIYIRLVNYFRDSYFKMVKKSGGRVVNYSCDSDFEMVQKVQLSRDNLIVKEKINVRSVIYDAALLPSNDLLMCVEGRPYLIMIPSGCTDLIASVYKVPPWDQPVGVHVTSDNRIIVGYNRYERVEEVIFIVMDQTGKHMKQLKPFYNSLNMLKDIAQEVFSPLSDLLNLKPVMYSVDISSNSKSVIAALVSNENISDQSRVVILDKEGKLRKVYTGHPDVNNKDNPFKPKGITATPSDNFVVADTPNHILHILNSEGEIVTFFNTQKIGILLPCSLSFSSTGQLYIGCATVKDSGEQAKIFKLESFFH